MSEFKDRIINIKDAKSQSVLFDTDDMDKMVIGGGKSDRIRFVSDEFANLVGKEIKSSQIKPLLSEVIDDGVGGVRLESISLDSFTLAINGNASTSDRIKFTGELIEDTITGIAGGFIDIKNRKSQIGIFEFNRYDNNKDSFFLGGGASDKSIVSDEFNDLVSGSRLGENDVRGLYDAAIGGGIDGVTLLFDGGTSSNFTLGLNANAGTQDIIIFSENLVST